MTPNNAEHRSTRHASLVGPAILIGLGVVLLLNNLGVITWSLWSVLWRFWPVLLIAAGLDLLIGRRSTLISAVLAVLTIAAIGFGVWYANTQTSAQGSSANLVAYQVDYAVDNATRASVEVQQQVGELRITAMSEPDGLIRGAVTLPEDSRLSREYSVSSGTAYLTLREERENTRFSSTPFTTPRWDLRLNPDIPLSLTISSGVGGTTLDLTKL